MPKTTALPSTTRARVPSAQTSEASRRSPIGRVTVDFGTTRPAVEGDGHGPIDPIIEILVDVGVIADERLESWEREFETPRAGESYTVTIEPESPGKRQLREFPIATQRKCFRNSLAQANRGGGRGPHRLYPRGVSNARVKLNEAAYFLDRIRENTADRDAFAFNLSAPNSPNMRRVKAPGHRARVRRMVAGMADIRDTLATVSTFAGAP